jgi:prepilin-type N-terminal cleavage/methylation domain-containing protein
MFMFHNNHGIRQGKKGFTLIELSLVVVLAAILAGAVIPNFVRSLHIEASRKTALEISQIAEASRVYYVQENSWPNDLQVLKTSGFLDSDWEGKNPFGNFYILELNGSNLQVSTSVVQTMTQVVAGLLPMSTVDGLVVKMSVTPPGVALASVPVGAMIPWPSVAIPDGWLVCDGAAVSRVDRASLFAVIGTTYGAGNGTTTFNLPDLRGRTVVGLDNMGGVAAHVITGAWAGNMGGTFGEEKHVLTVGEMPAHTHSLGTTLNPNGSGNGELEGSYGNAHSINHAANSASVGGGTAHNIIQPSMAVNWIIHA